MSLINNLLKDLETRERKFSSAPPIKLHGVQQKKWPLPEKWILIPAILSILVLFLVIALSLKSKPTIEKVKALELQPKAVHKSTFLPAMDSSWLKPVSITGVSLQIKDQTTEISFLLNHPVWYRISQKDDSVTVSFDDAQIEAELPSLQGMQSAVENMQMIPSAQSIHFTFKLAPGASLKDVDLKIENQKSALVLNLAYAGKPIVAIPRGASARSLYKTPAISSIYAQEYQRAINLAEAGDFKASLHKLKELLIANPDFLDARVTLAALHMDQGNIKIASDIIDAGLKIDPNYVSLVELKARILTQQGHYQKALNLLLSTLPPLTDNPDYHAFIAALYERTGSDLLAVKIYKKLLDINPNNSNWWFGIGLSLEKLNQIPSARNAYDRALALGNLPPDTLGFLQTRIKQLHEAAAHEA